MTHRPSLSRLLNSSGENSDSKHETPAAKLPDPFISDDSESEGVTLNLQYVATPLYPDRTRENA